MQNETRRLELSGKLMEMGRALLSEGTNEKDYAVSQSGTILVLISALILSDDDMFIFSELCAMFSAKKILDEEDRVNPNEKEMENQMFLNILKKMKINAEEKTPEAPKKRRGGRKPKDSDDSEIK